MGDVVERTADGVRVRPAAVSPRRRPGPELGIRRSTHQLVVDGTVVNVPTHHFALLLILLDAGGQVVTPRHLTLQAGLPADTDLPSLIRYLRRKLGPYARCVVTVYGRGYYWHSPTPDTPPSGADVPWSLDEQTRTLHTPSGRIRLTPIETRILAELIDHTEQHGPGALYPSQQLLLAVGGDTTSSLTRAIATIRAKLGPAAYVIGNKHGRGYYLDPASTGHHAECVVGLDTP